MPRQLILTDNGSLELKEARASGLDGVTLSAPAALAGSYSIIMPTALPAALEFLAIDAAGQLSTSAGSATLDAAYDAGRIITADAGPVEAAGAGGFLASHSAPVYGLETTGAERNYRLTAGQTAGILEIQVGDADGDISDDVFATMLALDGGNQRLGFGTAAPVTLAHFVAPAGLDAVLRLDATIGMDAAVTLFEDGVSRWKIGYDDSAGGLVVGRLSFANPTIFVADTTGDVGIGELVPDARLHVFEATDNDVAVFEAGVGLARISIKSSTTTAIDSVMVGSFGDDLQLTAGGSILVHLDGADQRVGIGVTTPTAKLSVRSTAAQIALLVDQDANAQALTIDSEATAAPLINLLPLAGNTRGDISANGTARAVDPTNPLSGDIWYNGASFRWKARLTGANVTFANILGPAFNAAVIEGILTGVAQVENQQTGVIILAAEAGTADTLDTLAVTGSGAVEPGDTLILRADTGDTITVAHNTGNIHLDGSANKVLVNGNQLMLIWDGTDWRQLTPMMVLP